MTQSVNILASGKKRLIPYHSYIIRDQRDLFVRDQEILVADIYSAVCRRLLTKKLYTNCLTSYFGIIPTNKLKYILGMFVTSSLCHHVHFIPVVANEWILCTANGESGKIREEESKKQTPPCFLAV